MRLTFEEKLTKAEKTLQEKLKGGDTFEIGLAKSGVNYSKIVLAATRRAAQARIGK